MRQRPVLLAALFVSSLAACADEGEIATDDAALVFHQRDAQVIRGTFDHAGSVVTFDSRLVGPEHASLRLEVNQVVLTIDLDLGSGLIETDGGLGALYPEDTAALLALPGLLAGYQLGASFAVIQNVAPVRQRATATAAP